MRVLAACFLASSALISLTALVAGPAQAATHKVTCLCDCPDDHKVKAKAAAPAPVRRTARRAVRRSGYYDYASAAPVAGGWHGEWRVAPNDGRVPDIRAYAEGGSVEDQRFAGCTQMCGAPAGYGPPPGAYGPPPGYGPEGVAVDDRGWTGGVGAMADGGGGGGGFMDGFGQVHFAQGGDVENGPTYNSYNQSFQYNPSVAQPFQNRLMGGLAPASGK